jgi:hypothetical protein
MSRIEGLRLVAGFVFAPAIGVLVLLLALFAKSVVAPVGNESFEFLAIFGLASAYWAYSATFIVGLPLFILFYVRRWFRLWQIAAGGLLVGVLVGLLPGIDIVLGLMFCAVGLATGIAFWLIVIFRNRALTTGSRADAPQAARA